MPLIQPRLLKGFRDSLPQVMIARKRMIETVTRVFESFGFVPLDTPALEYADILLGKYGADGEKLLYRFQDNGGRDVALRYDLTVPLARVAAQYRDLPKPFRRYQVGPVWRAESPQKGRFREFLQCDVDIVGSSSLLADAECIVVDTSVMRALDVGVTVRINNRKVFRGLQTLLAVDGEDQFLAVLRAIDKLERDGQDSVKKDLTKNLGLSGKAVDNAFRFLSLEGSNAAKLKEAEKLFRGANADNGIEGLTEIRTVLEAAVDLGAPEAALVFDPSIARGLDYYTGTVFETKLNDLPGIGSVMSGGRYDDLVSVFIGEVIPAVGISVGLDRLIAGLEELGRLPKATATAQAYVSIFADDLVTPTLDCVRQLREAGINIEMAYESTNKLSKQIKVAEAKGIPFLVILGPDEARDGKLALRNMATREQETLSLEQAVDRIRRETGWSPSATIDPPPEVSTAPSDGDGEQPGSPYSTSVTRDTGMYAVGGSGPEIANLKLTDTAVLRGKNKGKPKSMSSKARRAEEEQAESVPDMPPDVAGPKPDKRAATSGRMLAARAITPPAMPPDVAAPKPDDASNPDEGE